MRELICITCPKGCHLRVDERTFEVSGNGCPRGAEYGAQEVRDPRRTLTTTVKTEGALMPRLPVRTNHTVAKNMLFECMKAADTAVAKAPVKVGDIIIKNIAGSGADLVSSCDLPAARKEQ